MHDTISPADLEGLLTGGADVTVLDVRRREHRTEVGHPIPGAEWRDPERIAEWSEDLPAGGEIVVFCVHGHNVSQDARDFLRERGHRARIVAGGIEAWEAFSTRS
jgi:Fe-Mn family superoxide dismutase